MAKSTSFTAARGPSDELLADRRRGERVAASPRSRIADASEWWFADPVEEFVGVLDPPAVAPQPTTREAQFRIID